MKTKIITMLVLAAALASCGKKTEDQQASTAAPESTPSSGSMATPAAMDKMAIPAKGAVTMAKGSGTVIAMDQTTGMITLDHDPIPEANWPAMTMAFKAKPALLDGVKAGDKVTFDLALKDGAGEVIALQKQ